MYALAFVLPDFKIVNGISNSVTKAIKMLELMIYTQLLISSKYPIMHASMNSPMSFPYGNHHAKDVAMLTWPYIPTS